MATTESYGARDVAHLLHPVTSPRELLGAPPRVVVAADGWTITDDRGRELIDGFAGLWCVAVGHRRPEIIDAIHRQLEELDYFTTFHGQSHPRAIELAERLVSLYPPAWDLRHVMFSSGGSEANETNIKLARLYWSLRGEPQRSTVIARRSGYHGLTIATMTATGIMPMRWNFGPEAPGFTHIAPPYCYRCELGATYPGCALACAGELERAILEQGPETVAAFIAEPVIGAGGIIPPPPGYFSRVREICDQYGVLFIADEVVTGFGRTGTMFGVEQWDVRPDIMTLAKGITSGYIPLGASVVSGEIWGTITERLPDKMPVSHGFTYSGHPVACAAALANLDIIERDGLVDNAATVGAYLLERLQELERFETVGEVRGLGLMAGVELVTDKATRRGFAATHDACVQVEHEAWARGLYCRAMGTEFVGLAPPLSIDRGVVDRMVEILAESIEAMERDRLAEERARAERAAARPRVDDLDTYFTATVVGRFDPDAAEAAGVEVVVQYDLAGPGGGTWVVRVAGRDLAVERVDVPIADAAATTRASAADFLAILNGELSGADAFSTQRLVIDGDLNATMALMGIGLL